MPIYSFECQQCQAIFDMQATFKEKEAGLEPACPQCQSQETKQLITAGLLLPDGKKINSPRSVCGPNVSPGCCG